jgi:hypothetical protein
MVIKGKGETVVWVRVIPMAIVIMSIMAMVTATVSNSNSQCECMGDYARRGE